MPRSQAERLAARLRRTKRRGAAGRKVVWVCRLREKRDALGLTLRDVEKATGVNNGTLSQTEHGADPTLSTAVKIAKFFGCTCEEMWPGPVERAKAK